MTKTTKIIVIALIVIIIGYHVYVASLKKDILKKLGSSNNQIKSDLDKMSMPELKHFGNLVDIYVEIKDKHDAPDAIKMKLGDRMATLLADPKTSSILKKTDGLKSFSGALSPEWIKGIVELNK